MTLPAPVPSTSTPAALHTLHGETMGTTWCVKVVASPRADLHSLHEGVQAQLDGVVAQMSTWRSDSDISRFNRASGGTWQAIPEGFLAVLSCALQVARESAGAYDPTVGPLVDAWGFGPAQRPRAIPDTDEIERALATVDWRRLQLRTDSGEALQPGGVQLDLSAIAKGFGVDEVARHLRERGIRAALVEVGGELYGYGCKPDGTHWQVLVEATPSAAAALVEAEHCVLVLDGAAVATSGDHWHAFEQQGVRYSHSLDPRTGRPVEHAAVAVTVVAADAMHADAWATALTVMGAGPGHRFAQASGIAARFVVAGDAGPATTMTDAFRARLAA